MKNKLRKKSMVNPLRMVWKLMVSNKLLLYTSLGEQLLSGRKEMFYLTTHLTHFIYGYVASDIW